MTEQLLTVSQFGSRLLETGDLDPIYVMLNRAHKDGVLDRATLMRWCLAYWCYYHAGTASRIVQFSLAEPSGFWKFMHEANSQKWPRSSERRHFRAKNAYDSLLYLGRCFRQPESAVQYAIGCDVPDPKPQMSLDIRDRVEEWVGFGPWISFKVADMLDAVLGVPVDFSDSLTSWFSEPVKGAVYVHGQLQGHDDWNNVEGLKAYYEAHTTGERHAMVGDVVTHLLGAKHFSERLTPHRPDHYVGIAEIETILCKYKSHLHGHYYVGKDTAEIRHGLSQFPSALASRLSRYLPDSII